METMSERMRVLYARIADCRTVLIMNKAKLKVESIKYEIRKWEMNVENEMK